ncbi:Altronate dehydratase [Sporomusa silvacetica DSM 10669]|uniref:Altronate dehydratase n=1 Tax=Sporomusa silvacetica DSM 10669 TaxID=1123289 RepID=A0ABZ3ITS3_9FIRM|nr:altronate dehydratase family protein [Sporomusa silvacetica]OZC19599.1 altronate dehydratase [Sporomusa silvacetica DSM 10669]
MSQVRIHEKDNVAVVLEADQGSEAQRGHKVALTDIRAGEHIIKYGFPIGHATVDIKAGQWVHTHNIKTNLGDILEYQYQPESVNDSVSVSCECPVFQGYRRADGRVGIRNEVWVIPTVSCVNQNIRLIAEQAAAVCKDLPNVDGIFAITHPYGCSQLGDDHSTTQRMLADLVCHPNAGAVLVVGLGCENNHIAEFKKVLGDYDPARVKFLVAQEVEDEVCAGVELVEELAHYASACKREDCPVSELVIGLKCGGSDGFSGITANPLVGALSDRLLSCGGSTVLTEVPEMFGAETILMNRAANRAVFDKTVNLINNFKEYFVSYKQPIYENPSPGNKAGGISTLEEKSLGCTQKGGTGQVTDVIGYAERVSKKGLTLLSSPGNDMVAATALAAAGCQIILFTTGRGTPLGTVIPTIKVATNSELFSRKTNWMDFDAGRLLTGTPMEQLTDEFLQYIIAVAAGQATKAEHMGFREIAIFKNGVTL